MTLEFPRQISEKNTVIPNSTKIRPVGAELFMRTDGRTALKLTVVIGNSANAASNASWYVQQPRPYDFVARFAVTFLKATFFTIKTV